MRSHRLPAAAGRFKIKSHKAKSLRFQGIAGLCHDAANKRLDTSGHRRRSHHLLANPHTNPTTLVHALAPINSGGGDSLLLTSRRRKV
jgi:hypothetical protein